MLASVFDIIGTCYGHMPNRYDALARDARVTRRTAQFWLSRSHAPRIPQLFLLMERNEQFRVAILAFINQMFPLK